MTATSNKDIIEISLTLGPEIHHEPPIILFWWSTVRKFDCLLTCVSAVRICIKTVH